MMHPFVRRGAVLALLVCVVACDRTTPTVPSRVSQPLVTFPPLSGSARSFIYYSELEYPLFDVTKSSRFVLYEDGAFVLQYLSLGEGGYRGRYEEANGVIDFEWDGASIAGPWRATGTLQGEFLTVRYNLLMQHSDFEDAVYVLMR